MVELVGEGKTKLKNQLKIPFQSPTSHKFFFKNLFNMTPKAQATTKNWISSNKHFHASSYTIKKVKRQSTKWEKLFANHRSHKGLSIRLYTEFLQLSNKKTNNPIKNGQSI